MNKASKWSDDEDDQDFIMRQKQMKQEISLPTKLIEEPNKLKEKSFLNWAKKTELKEDSINPKFSKSSRIGRILRKEQNNKIDQTLGENSGVTPISQILKKDSLKCAVKTLDYLPNNTQTTPMLWLYAGIGKTLKICKLDTQNNSYSIVNSFFFQNENILQSRFLDSSTVASQILKKKYVSIFDIKKEKSTKLFKLFSDGISNNKRHSSKKQGYINCLDVNKERNLIGVSSSNLFSLIDRRSKGSVFQKNLMKTVSDLKFRGNSEIVYQTNSGLFRLDLR